MPCWKSTENMIHKITSFVLDVSKQKSIISEIVLPYDNQFLLFIFCKWGLLVFIHLSQMKLICLIRIIYTVSKLILAMDACVLHLCAYVHNLVVLVLFLVWWFVHLIIFSSVMKVYDKCFILLWFHFKFNLEVLDNT